MKYLITFMLISNYKELLISKWFKDFFYKEFESQKAQEAKVIKVKNLNRNLNR